MYIEGRKEKKYSGKLFGELCLLLLLRRDGEAPLYFLRSRLGVSDRTLFRYAKELHDCGLTPPVTRKVRVNESGRFPYFESDPEVFKEYRQIYMKAHESERFPYYDEYHFYMEYTEKNKGRDSRLRRCGLLLLENSESLIPADELFDEDEAIPSGKEIIKIEGRDYCFSFCSCDSLYDNLSPRSRQRDARIVKDVLISMYEG